MTSVTRLLRALAVGIGFVVLGTIGPAGAAEAPRAAEARVEDYFTRTEIERSERYRSTRYLLGFSALGLSLAVVALLGLGGGSRVLGSWVGTVTGRWWVQAALLALVVTVVPRLFTVPLSIAGHGHDRAYELATNSLPAHLLDVAKASGFQIAIAVVAALAFVGVARWLPRGWPAVAAAGGIALTVALVYLFPVVYEPAFNRFDAVADPDVRGRILRLADRADVRISEVLVADASRRTTRQNAYVSGIGSTRRVVLYDTLLAKSPPEQIDFVVAHELAHVRHNDVLKGTVYAAAGVVAGVLVIWLLLSWTWLRSWLGIAGAGDPRAVPFLAFFIAAAALVTLPAANAISRHVEDAADRAAIEITEDPQAAIDLHVSLARDSISDLTPNRFLVWVFASHPPVLERIETALEAAGRP